MIHVLSIDEAIQEVVGETVAHGGLELFDELRREFPQATITTINLAALLDALDEAVEREDA